MPAPDPDTIKVLRAITAVATRRQTFSADDVREELRLRGYVVARTGDPRQRVHPNALGGGFHLARKTGLIIEVGTIRSSAPAARSRRITLYRMAGTPAPEPVSQQQVIL